MDRQGLNQRTYLCVALVPFLSSNITVLELIGMYFPIRCHGKHVFPMFIWAVTDSEYVMRRCGQDLAESCLIAAFIDPSQSVFDDSLSHQTPFACGRRVLLGVAFARA